VTSAPAWFVIEKMNPDLDSEMFCEFDRSCAAPLYTAKLYMHACIAARGLARGRAISDNFSELGSGVNFLITTGVWK